jgi:ABC-type amino acid transport substrate-binding protein
MKPVTTITTAVILAFLSATIAVKMNKPHENAVVEKETAYQHVMRTRTIRCGYFVWEPYVMKDPNTGKFSGINYDVMEEVGKKLDLKIEWTTDTDIAGMVQGLEIGKFDVLCATNWPNAGLLKNITLTSPEFYTPVYGVVRKDDNRFDGDLQKANNPSIRVSAIDSDITADLAREFLPKATPSFLPQTGNGADILLQIMTGKADIAFVDKGLVNNFVKNNPNSLRIVADIPPARIFGERLAVGRHEFELKEMIDLSLEQLVNDKVIEKLVNKYKNSFNTEIIPPDEAFTLTKGP